MSYLFFKAHDRSAGSPLPGGEFRLETWTPTLLHPLRWDLPPRPFLVWSLFHFLGIFAGRDYFLLLVFRGSQLVHRTCVLPAHFRFPFMAPGDLQTAALWTDPAFRGRGLGLLALRDVIRRVGAPARPLWYLVREDNPSSIRLAEKAGFRLAGKGRRVNRLGIRVAGCFRLEGIPNR